MVSVQVISNLKGKEVFLRFQSKDGRTLPAWGILLAFDNKELNLKYTDGSETTVSIELEKIVLIRPDGKNKREGDDGRQA